MHFSPHHSASERFQSRLMSVECRCQTLPDSINGRYERGVRGACLTDRQGGKRFRESVKNRCYSRVTGVPDRLKDVEKKDLPSLRLQQLEV